METRSAKRRSQGPVAVASEKSPSRRRQKTSRGLTYKSVLEDSGISTDAPKESATKTKTTARDKTLSLDDTPKHLYGLDKEDVSSGDETTVDSKGGTQENLGEKRTHRLRYVVGFCLVIATLVLVGLIGLAVQRSQNQDSLVHGNQEIKISQDHEELAYNFMELQDKLEVLSSKVNGLLAQDKMSKQDEELKRNYPSVSNEHLKNIVEDLVKEKMEAALDTYSADKLGIPDFALESAGAQIHEPYHSVSFSKDAPVVSFFGIPLYYNINSPRIIIQPDNTPGNCWAFEGQKGFVTIKLSKRIKVTAFTMEHIPTTLSSTGDGRIPSAPKDFSVWGWKDSHGNHQKCIGLYTYDSTGKPLQTFPAQETDSTFKYVQLRIHSNHGNPKYTCIYRFRVHGEISAGCSGTKTQNANKKQSQDKGL